MKEATKEVKPSTEVTEFTALIVDAIQDMKGENILQLDLRDIADSPCDYFIIADAESTVRCQGIAKNIKSRTKHEADTLPHHVEGFEEGKWILLDYLNILVHIFYKEQREYYNLEDLWHDAKTKHFE